LRINANPSPTVRRFNATLSAKGYVWFWPKIAAALTSKHHWLIIACDSCGTVVDLDLRVKPRKPEVSIRAAPRDVQCPRCNGYGLAHHCVGAASVDLKVQCGRCSISP
jgi:transcription elongation factor Elf1